MSNFNGLGPNNEGKLTGRGRGNCLPSSTTATKIGIGLGMGLAWGCKRGLNRPGFKGHRGFQMGIGRRYKPGFQYNQETLAEYKKFLEEELEILNHQSEEEELD